MSIRQTNDEVANQTDESALTVSIFHKHTTAKGSLACIPSLEYNLALNMNYRAHKLHYMQQRGKHDRDIYNQANAKVMQPYIWMSELLL